MNKITAEEAKALTNKLKIDLLEKVYDHIRNAAERGKDAVTVDIYFEYIDFIKEMLIKDGFFVMTNYGDDITISW